MRVRMVHRVQVKQGGHGYVGIDVFVGVGCEGVGGVGGYVLSMPYETRDTPRQPWHSQTKHTHTHTHTHSHFRMYIVYYVYSTNTPHPTPPHP